MYKPINQIGEPGFSGIRTFMHLPHVTNLENVDFAVIGVPFDTGVSYAIGTRFGPSAIREMSQRLRGVNPEMNCIDIFDYLSGVDYGDVIVHPGYIELSYKAIEEQLTPIFEQDVIPVLLGGDHSISLPHLRAAAKKYGPLSLVHFDSHTDTGRMPDERKKYSHGSMFSLAVDEGLLDPHSSIQIGMRGTSSFTNPYESSTSLGYEVLTTDDVKKLQPQQLGEMIKERVGDRPVFLTFDIDFLDPAYAPGTGTPEVGGFSTIEAFRYLQELVGLNIIGFDLVEVLPDRDLAQVTALNAAHIIKQVLSVLATTKKNNLEAKLIEV